MLCGPLGTQSTLARTLPASVQENGNLKKRAVGLAGFDHFDTAVPVRHGAAIPQQLDWRPLGAGGVVARRQPPNLSARRLWGAFRLGHHRPGRQRLAHGLYLAQVKPSAIK